MGALYQQRLEALVAQRRSKNQYPHDLLNHIKFSYKTLFSYETSRTKSTFAEELTQLMGQCDVNIDVQIQRSRRSIYFIKWLTRNVFAWYLKYLVQQFNNSARVTTNLMSCIHTRISAVEGTLTGDILNRRFFRDTHIEIKEISELIAVTQRRLREKNRRILVYEASDTKTVAAFENSFSQAYGVTSPNASFEGDDTSDIRKESLEYHLSRIAKNSLAAIIVTDAIEVTSAFELLALIEQIKMALVPGGLLCMLIHETNSSRADDTFHRTTLDQHSLQITPKTWSILLSRCGFSHIDSSGTSLTHSTILSAIVEKHLGE